MTTNEEPIAVRQLEQNGQPVTVEVFAPTTHEQHDWECRYRITGLADRPVIAFHAYGVDSAQALMLALDQIGDQLALHEGVTYLGQPDLDFPVSAPTAEASGRTSRHTGR